MFPVGTAEVVLALVLQGTTADVPAALDADVGTATARAGERRVTLDVINDGFATIYDEGYTSGVRLLVRTGPWFEGLSLGRWLGGRRVVAEYWTAGLAHEIWTPADLTADRASLLADDRPYAGMLSADAQVDLVVQGGLLEDGYSRLSARLMVGVTGDWSGSESIQRVWHSGLRQITGQDYPKEPQGWDVYEIPETVLVNLHLGVESEVLRATFAETSVSRLTAAPLGTRAAARASCDVGTFRVGCETGLTLRVGWMPELTLDGATPIVEAAAPTPLPVSAHLLVGTRVGVMAFDALLDGPVGTDSPSASKRIVRARLEVGAIVQLWAAEIAYTYIIETNELSPLPYWAQPYQRMGQIKLTYRW